jgi:hypothetical protein
MQNVHVVSKLKLNALSNDAVGFTASLLFNTGKWIRLFAQAVLAFNHHL